MLVVVPLLERFERVHVLGAPVHGAEHADDEAVDPVRLFHLRDERRDAALVVGRAAEVGKDELLERVDVVLQVHQVHDRLEAVEGLVPISKSACRPPEILMGGGGMSSPFVRVVDTLEGDVLFVLKQAVERRVVSVKLEFSEDEFDIRPDERAIACKSKSSALAKELGVL